MNTRSAVVEVTYIVSNSLNTMVTSGTLSNMQLFWTLSESANSATLEVYCVFWNNTLLNVSICFTNDKVKSLECCSTNFFAE